MLQSRYMVVDDAYRFRVVRAMLGDDGITFAAKLGVSVGSIHAWESGKRTPQAAMRMHFVNSCKEWGIVFASGHPAPVEVSNAATPED